MVALIFSTRVLIASNDPLPSVRRVRASSASVFRSAKRLVKKAKPSAGSPAAYWPTLTSPSEVLRKTLPCSSARPYSFDVSVMIIPHSFGSLLGSCGDLYLLIMA